MTVEELHKALGQIVTRGEPVLSEKQLVLQTPDGPYEIHSLNLEHHASKAPDLYLVGDIPRE
jgi:hypothetical protein